MRSTAYRWVGAIPFSLVLGASLVAQDTSISSKDLLDGLSNPSRWLSYSGDYSARRHSPLTQITAANVSRLTPQRTFQNFLDAYDPKDGSRVWGFWTVPAPGEPGSQSWPAQTWERGGGPTRVPGSYDPDLNLVYWGPGNPTCPRARRA